jgi:hypothetical protein
MHLNPLKHERRVKERTRGRGIVRDVIWYGVKTKGKVVPVLTYREIERTYQLDGPVDGSAELFKSTNLE